MTAPIESRDPPVLTGVAAGKSARNRLQLDALGEWRPPSGRADPIALLERQAQALVPQLVSIHFGRLLKSPFAFFRGTAGVMAADLAHTRTSGFQVQLCGDANICNFAGFAGAGRRELVFDINDFDETLRGPWEWDVKRLAASLEIAGREQGVSDKKLRKLVRSTAQEYQSAMQQFAVADYFAVWSTTLDLASIRRRWGREFTPDRPADLIRIGRSNADRQPLTGARPVILRFHEVMERDEAAQLDEEMHFFMQAYMVGLADLQRQMLSRFTWSETGRHLAGFGSTGVVTNLVLFSGRDDSEKLVLQLKEAGPSPLEPYAGRSAYAHHGRRVVEGQRLIQAVDDPLLGWVRGRGPYGVVHDYYVRQLRERKLTPETETLTPRGLHAFGRACAWTLARAHARSGDRVAISTYLGRGQAFANAIDQFARAYADQNELDYHALLTAVDRGRVFARTAA